MNNSNVSQPARYYFYMMMLGIFATTTLASWLAPAMITWWYDSPAPTPITAACVTAIDWAIQMLQMVQIGAVILGAVLGLLFAFRFRSRPQAKSLN